MNDEIPQSLAYAAHAGTSFDPQKRAAQEIESHAAELASDFERLLKEATTPEKRALLDAEFARYRAAYTEKKTRYLTSRSRIVSSMIAGPSNFPVRRMEKRNHVADKRLSEMLDFRERALQAIHKTLNPELRPIMAGDNDAEARLLEKIAQAEAEQARMKAANAAIRKHSKDGRAAQAAALVALGFPEGAAGRLLEPDFAGRIGFADYETRNNGANIRRMQQRLVAIRRNKATPETTVHGSAARLDDCPGENRVRLIFPGKPSPEILKTLKSSGWRWTPSLGCWQAYRNWSSLALGKSLAGLPPEPRPAAVPAD